MANAASPSTTIVVNNLLLHCIIDLEHNSSPQKALFCAESALETAKRAHQYDLESKCQFWRGRCLMDLERWHEASLAFTRAASVKDWKGRVAVLKMECERQIERDSSRTTLRRCEGL
ncbi:hypothetical protein B0O99DRAFT_110710 [Bisporella sp. PMI_857]|nr:hypothetical protein B0O99DRAFT_110710 [Bisporella sp. PMI_857]